jgi:hypothetical protein
MKKWNGILGALALVLIGYGTIAAAERQIGVRYRPETVSDMIRIGDKGFALMSAKWSSPTIPVCWEPGSPGGVEREWVKQAVRLSWEAHSRLRFVGWAECAPKAVGLRVVVRDAPGEYPRTEKLGQHLNSIPNGMTLNFTFRHWGQDCAASEEARKKCIVSIAVHEFGHAVAFAHEQNSHETPGECALKRQGPDGDTPLTPWDLESVMNYCNPTYLNNGMLSKNDIISVVKIYGA